MDLDHCQDQGQQQGTSQVATLLQLEGFCIGGIMLIKKISFTSLIMAFVVSAAFAHEKKWPEKRLRQVWPEAQGFTSKQVTLTSGQITELKNEDVKISGEDRSPTFYFAQERTSQSDQKMKTSGVILFLDEVGANGKMEISVAMGTDGKIKKIDLWEHSENALAAKDDYLKQFIGKSAKDSFEKNKDYRPVAEAEKASEAIAVAAKKALKISNILFEKK